MAKTWAMKISTGVTGKHPVSADFGKFSGATNNEGDATKHYGDWTQTRQAKLLGDRNLQATTQNRADLILIQFRNRAQQKNLKISIGVQPTSRNPSGND